MAKTLRATLSRFEFWCGSHSVPCDRADLGDNDRGDEGSDAVEIGIAFGQEMDRGQLAWFTLCV